MSLYKKTQQGSDRYFLERSLTAHNFAIIICLIYLMACIANDLFELASLPDLTLSSEYRLDFFLAYALFSTLGSLVVLVFYFIKPRRWQPIVLAIPLVIHYLYLGAEKLGLTDSVSFIFKNIYHPGVIYDLLPKVYGWFKYDSTSWTFSANSMPRETLTWWVIFLDCVFFAIFVYLYIGAKNNRNKK